MLLWRLMCDSDTEGVADLIGNPRLSYLTSLKGMKDATILEHAKRLLDRSVWCETAWASGKCVGMIALRDTMEGCAWLSVVVDSQRLGLWKAMQEARRAVVAMQEASPADAVYMCRTHIENVAAQRILWSLGWKCLEVDDPWTVWDWCPAYATRKTGVGYERRINGGSH